MIGETCSSDSEFLEVCAENWYHKLHWNYAVQSNVISKFPEIAKNARFLIGLTLDCVIQMKVIMIPIFRTEFDALRVSFHMFG